MDTRNDRYARQRQFTPIGEAGQQRILSSSVAIIGCGALGSVAAEILARAGVGRLRLIDRDIVQWSNLQRQSLFTESDADAAVAKSGAIERHLSAINSDITVESIVCDLVPSNFAATVGTVDLVIDAVDNFLLRFLINDWSLKTGTPWVHGGCVGATGQVRLFDGTGRPCFRCLVPTPPPPSAVQTCDTAGVVGAATHAIAALQCVEAIKWLSSGPERDDSDRDKINAPVQSFDFWTGRHRSITLPPSISDGCVACERRDYQYLDGDAGASMESAAVLCGRDSVQLTSYRIPPGRATSSGGKQIAGDAGSVDSRAVDLRAVDLRAIADQWANAGKVTLTRFFARLVVDSYTITMFRDGRMLVDGTDDIATAKAIAARYVGQ